VIFLAAEGPPGEDGWSRLPEPRREDFGSLASKDARFTRLDRAAKILALGALRALGERTFESENTGIVLASLTGSLAADEAFDETRSRPEGPSPLLFPPTLATSPAAELSIRLGLGGPVFAVRAGIKAAVALASRIVERGEADLVLACGLEVAARGAHALLGTKGPFRESVFVACIDRPVGVRLTDALDLPRGPLLANEDAPLLLQALK
jgi:hypothetical protein